MNEINIKLLSMLKPIMRPLIMLQAVSDAINTVAGTIYQSENIFERLAEIMLMPSDEEIVQSRIREIDYPNKRIKHLALHHPKARVRKKNQKRILRERTT